MIRFKRVCAGIFFCLCLLFGMNGVSLAENRALEQLLELFEKKGVVTASEVEMIRQTIAEDQKALLEKEKALTERENILQKREKTIEKTEHLLPEATLSIKEPSTEKETDSTDLPLKAVYQDGLCFRTPESEMFSLCLGGLLQTDYRFFDYNSTDPNKNKFDLRRVRLLIGGRVLNDFDYKFEYEFQGADSRNLLDAYVDAHIFSFASLRIGQFKEPFSLEQSTKDKNLFFAERSMGYYLTPQRDVGLMAHASLWNDKVNYGLGIFNGDGRDDATGGDEDAPEVTGRFVIAPFKGTGSTVLGNFQVGGSFGYANIDRNNVALNVKTTGMTSFLTVTSNTKFGIIRDADYRTRYGAELGWAYGPMALTGEYTYVLFKDIQTSSDQFDSYLKDYYVALFWMLTGERPSFKNGIFQPITPLKSFGQGGWGGFGLAFRYDVFEADKTAYDNLINTPGNSVREATAYTLALNWYLNAHAQLILDATSTSFDRPLLIDRDSLTGTSIYSDRENVLTGRFQFQF